MSIRRSVVVPRADSATPSGSAPPVPSPPHGSHQLSVGVIAGISVAGAVAIVGLMAIVSLFVSRHRRRRMRELSQSNALNLGEEVKIELPPPHKLGHLTTATTSVASLLHVEERRSSGGSTKKKGKDAEENPEGGYLRQGYMSLSLEDALPAYSVPLSIPDHQPSTSSKTHLESTSTATQPPLPSPHSPLSPPQSPLSELHPPHTSLPNPHDIHLPNPYQHSSPSDNHASGDTTLEPTDTVVVSPPFKSTIEPST